jgi:ATP-dependent DNA helicase PIF1
MRGRQNVFLTGSAGTGKTTVIVHYLGSAFERTEITATTGIAAINLREKYSAASGGRDLLVSTIYRWAGIGIGPKPGQSDEEYSSWLMANATYSQRNAWTRVRKAESIVIDEISMLPGRILDFLNFHCQKLREDDRPFGGIRVIFVGDFLQLPPVSKNGTYDWSFASRAWRAADIRPLVLTHIHRQEDAEFSDLLNAVRVGRLTPRQMSTLTRRVAMFPKSDIVRLFTHNVQVDKWNNYQLEAIDGESVTYGAELAGSEWEQKQLRQNILSPEFLTLKIGARVMVTVNQVRDGALAAVNGEIGTVYGLGKWGVEVTLDSGRKIALDSFRWTLDAQNEASASMTQIPLRLAWASTIHKAQGLTLDNALVDLRATREPGQAYVALSRVRSLAGLHLKDTFKGLWVSDEAIKFHAALPALTGTPPLPELQLQ